ncbi:MAG: ribbon-helix-helix domain-containing protein [Oscillospiraceae bacterium]|nr:ribbon-helix-helix domain-containing protein [Oscillospiraceae bacterium]
MATDKPRYTVSVDRKLFQQIEDFRFEHRYQTRSEATVELIRLGLEALRQEAMDERADAACGKDSAAE